MPRRAGDAGIPPAENARERPYHIMVGDPMPEGIVFREFLLGEPFEQFDKGKVYLIDNWTTLSEVSLDYMSRLTEFQNKWASAGLVVVGVTDPGTKNTVEVVKDWVFNKAADRIGYTIVWDRARKFSDFLTIPAGHDYLPVSVIIDRQGRIAFIGHPAEVEKPLTEIMSGTFNMELAERLYGRCIECDRARKHFFKFMKEQDYVRAYGLARVMTFDRCGECWDAMIDIAWTILDPAQLPVELDIDVAVAAAEKANELTLGRDADSLNVLARAHFMKGDYARAVETQKKAIAACTIPEKKAKLEKPIRQYEAGLEQQLRNEEVLKKKREQEGQPADQPKP